MNRNEKIISLGLITILLFSGIDFVSAPPPGEPWFVDAVVKEAVSNSGVVGANVTITNLGTGESFSGVTSAGGFLEGEQLTEGVEAGDTIRVQASEGSGTGTTNHVVTSLQADGAGITIYVTLVYPLNVTLSVVQNQCAGTAVFTAAVTGGNGNYSYDWSWTGGATKTSGGSSSDNTMTLSGSGVSGTVTVTVTDTASNDDSDSEGYSLNAALGANGSWSVDCSGEVTFTVNASGGSPNYTYSIDVGCNGYEYTNTTSLTSVSTSINQGWGASGTWKWKVVDSCSDEIASGCESWSVPNELVVQFSSSTVNQCTGQVTITASASGGSAPYQYVWDKDGDGFDDGTGTTRTFDVGYGISGTIKVRVTDDCSNKKEESFQYTTYPQLAVDITEVNVSCDRTTVEFIAVAQGGSGTYEYLWDIDGDGFDDGTGTTKTITPGINQSGTVRVKAIDSNTYCETIDSTSYNTSYTPLSGSCSWDWNCDGDLVLTIYVSGGTPSYTYHFDAGSYGTYTSAATSATSYQHIFTSADWNDSGQWSWTVTDNCSQTDDGGPTAWSIPSQLALEWASITNDHCDGFARFQASASGGSGSYRYDWDLDNNGTYEVTNGGAIQTINGYGISGTIKVRVTDVTHSCTATLQGTYQINDQLVVDLQVAVDNCAAEAVFTAAAQGGEPGAGYTYDWDMDNNGTFELINAGSRQVLHGQGINGRVNVRANDVNCSATDFVNYLVNPPLSLNVDVRYGDGVATFTAEGDGGGEGYVYDWDLDGNGVYEVLNGGQEQRLYGYDTGGTIKTRVTDACSDQAEETTAYHIPEKVVVDPPTEVFVKGTYELDEVTPHEGSPSYIVMWYKDNDAATYTIQESTSPNFGTITDEYITTGLRKKYSNKPDGTYYYRVKGCNAAGCTEWSETMAAIVGQATIAPNPPTALVATSLSETSIGLTWSDNSDNEAGFRLYRNGTLVATLPANASSYTDQGLTCGTSYTYALRAYNGAGNSPVSNTAIGTTDECSVQPGVPQSPTDTSAQASSGSEIELSWTDNSDNEDGFKVYRDNVEIADLPLNSTTYTDSGLACGTDYAYSVVAYNSVGQSTANSCLSGRTDDCQVQTTTPAPSETYYRCSLFSPAYLHALDAMGRHIGRIGDGEIEILIPGGTYSGLDSHPQIITVYNPQSEIQFYFEAYDEGTVTLNIEASEDGETETYSFKDLSIQNGSVFLVNAGASSGQLDIDGDGTYEQQITGMLIMDGEDGGNGKTMMYVALFAAIVLIAVIGLYLTKKKD